MTAEVFPGPVINLGVDSFFVVVILFFFNLPFIYVIFPEKEMATHFSILAWKISGTEEAGEL